MPNNGGSKGHHPDSLPPIAFKRDRPLTPTLRISQPTSHSSKEIRSNLAHPCTETHFFAILCIVAFPRIGTTSDRHVGATLALARANWTIKFQTCRATLALARPLPFFISS